MEFLKEKELDMFLQINTRGVQQGFHRSLHYHRYEPTPYAALEKLFQVYEPLSNPKWVDYGSGKGRVGFYIFAFHRIPSVGIEMDEGFLQVAQKNLVTFQKGQRLHVRSICFHHGLAENYTVCPKENTFYFFHPFSVQVFMQVVGKILSSVEAYPRTVDLILYYPTTDYRYFLEKRTAFILLFEIETEAVSGSNGSECFMIFRLNGTDKSLDFAPNRG